MKSLKTFKQQRPLVVDAQNQVVAGNGTLETMRRLKWTNCFIVRTGLTGAEAEAYAIADNKTGDLSEFDFEKLAETMKRIQPKIDLDVTGFQEYEREPLLQADWSPPEVSDAAPGTTTAKGHTVHFTEEQWEQVQEYIQEIREKETEYDVSSDAAAIQMGLYYCNKHLN